MTKSKQPEYHEANLSTQQMQAALPKLDRRIKDLQDFDVSSVVDRSDPRINALEQKLDTLLVTIFGANTVEHQRYEYDAKNLDRARWNAMYEVPIEEVREGLQKGVSKALACLDSIKAGFEEELEDSGLSSSTRSLKAYEGLELHPEIEKAVGSLYKNGHYANAVEDAGKALNALVRLRSGIDDKDGTKLMEFVFSPNNPILKFNSLSDDSDKDEQKGFMMMLSGAVAGLRNPRAHKIIKDDPEMALEFIAYISLLAKLVDRATK